jgi:LmbE family N-acetylglucosaminyl deacetylase
MLPLHLDDPSGEPLRVLALGAHCDDIEIGCGGTILTWTGMPRPVDVEWVVFASNEVRAREARASAERFLEGAHAHRVEILAFRESYFPYVADRIKDQFEALKARVRPDVVLTHYRNDLHQDHRLLAELCWNTFRNHLILEYEIPKYDADLAQPNVFVALTPEVVERKIEIVVESFASQATKSWFDAETFRALLRLRGVESASPTRYAEAFHCRKVLVGTTSSRREARG